MKKLQAIIIVSTILAGMMIACLSTAAVRATPFSDSVKTDIYPCSGASDYAFNEYTVPNVHFCHKGDDLIIYMDWGQYNMSSTKYEYRSIPYNNIEQLTPGGFQYCAVTSSKTAGSFAVYDCRDYYWFKNSNLTDNEAYRSYNYCWYTNGGDYDISISCVSTLDEVAKDGGGSGGTVAPGQPGHAQIVRDCKKHVNEISKGGYGGLVCSVGDLLSRIVDGLMGWLGGLMRWSYLVPNAVPELSTNPCGYDPASQACEDYWLLYPCEKDANSEACKEWREKYPCSNDPNSEECKREREEK